MWNDSTGSGSPKGGVWRIGIPDEKISEYFS